MFTLFLLVASATVAAVVAVRRFGLLSMPTLMVASAILFRVLPPALHTLEIIVGVDRPWMQPHMWMLSREDVLFSDFASTGRIATTFAFIGIALVLGLVSNARTTRQPTETDNARILWTAVTLLVVGLAAYYFKALRFGGIGGLLDQPWSERHAPDTAGQIVAMLENCVPAAFICIFVLPRSNSSSLGSVVRLGLAFAGTAALMFVQGSRLVGFSIFTGGLFAASLGRRTLERNVFIVSTAVVLAAMIGWMFIRGVVPEDGIEGAPDAIFESYRSGGLVGLLERGLELGNYGYYLAVCQDVPRRFDYLYGDSYLRILTFWIPRAIWPDKPYSTNTIVAQWYRPEFVGLSLNATLFGEAHMNFGFAGQVFVPPLYAVVVVLLWKRVLRLRVSVAPVLSILGLNYALFGYRSEVMTPLFNLGFQMFMVVAIGFVVDTMRQTRAAKAFWTAGRK